jgi:hypothetical protein
VDRPPGPVANAALLGQAEDFAAEITDVLQGVAQAPCPPLIATAAPNGRFTVRQNPGANAVRLTVGGVPLISLRLDYRCWWDQAQQYLAVERSTVKVIAGRDGSKEPLFRYEFVRGTADHVPGAHIHVHAHRDDLTWLMTRADRNGDGQLRRLHDWHFALGGGRFRPCLEDVLEMLINEVGVDVVTSDARERLARGRLRWRDRQLRAAVRDHPTAAAEVLTAMSYRVTPPADGHPPRDEVRLRRL